MTLAACPTYGQPPCACDKYAALGLDRTGGNTLLPLVLGAGKKASKTNGALLCSLSTVEGWVWVYPDLLIVSRDFQIPDRKSYDFRTSGGSGEEE